MKNNQKVVAIFASGTGSNAIKIIEHLSVLYSQNTIKFIILSNKKDAPILQKAQNLGIETLVFNRTEFYEQKTVVEFLQINGVDLVVLAGFLWLVPTNLIETYPQKIINIHPALLPKFGGKGMFGINIHKAVKEANEKTTGITIHYVNQHYDEGKIILQKQCEVYADDTPEMIAARVLQLEHQWFPKVVGDLLGEVG